MSLVPDEFLRHPERAFPPESPSDRFVRPSDIPVFPIDGELNPLDSTPAQLEAQRSSMLNEQIDPAPDFAATIGRALIVPDFMPFDVASRVFEFLDKTMVPDWWHYAFHAPFSTERCTTQNEIAIVDNKIASEKEFLANRIAYRFRRSIDDHFNECSCGICLTTLTFQGDAVLDRVSAVLGYRVDLNTSFMSYYAPGDFLSPHTDAGNGDVAFVWNLTTVDWRPQWGGLLNFLNNSWTESTQVIPPTFNSLVMFDVDSAQTPHFVSHVAPNVKEKRLAFSGWFRRMKEGEERSYHLRRRREAHAATKTAKAVDSALTETTATGGEIFTLEGPLGPFMIPGKPDLTHTHARKLCEDVWAGEYDSPELPSLIAPRVIDIGSHCGSFAVWARKRWPDAVIACFDPNIEACFYARRNAPFATIFNVAITTDSNAKYFLPEDWGSARTFEMTEGDRVETLHPRDLGPAEILKCDAEGVELEVLSNYAHWSGLKVLLYEYHPFEADARAKLRAIAIAKGFVNIREVDGYSGSSVWVRPEALKDLYKKIPGTFMYPGFYDFLVKDEALRIGKLGRRMRFVEIGVFKGQSIAYFASKCLETYCGGAFTPEIHLVDLGLTGHGALANLEPVRDLITNSFDMASTEAAQRYGDGYFDVVYIDAAHDYDNVRADIAAWLPKVRPGGIIAGHDYASGHPGVMRAVQEAFSKINVDRGERFLASGPDIAAWKMVSSGEPGHATAEYSPSWWVRVPEKIETTTTIDPAIAIMAIHRPAPNVFSTLAAAHLADDLRDVDLHIVLDSTEIGPAETIEHLAKIDLLTVEESRAQSPRSGGPRSLMTYERCLEQANADGVLVLEDDLSFSVDWLQRAKKAIVESIALCGDRFALYLYWYDHTPLPEGVSRVDDFNRLGYATLGVYWPAPLAAEIRQELLALDHDEINSNNLPWSADAFIANQLNWKKIPLLVMNPNVVQHFGHTNSTVIGNTVPGKKFQSSHFDAKKRESK